MKHHILIPVDFSDLSQKAISLAVQMADTIDADITLLNIVPASGEILVDISGNLIESEDFDSAALKGEMENARERLKDLSSRYAGTAFNFIVRPGQPEIVVIHELNQGNYDLIIMATHGATGMKEFFIGSHTEHIAMKSKVPVLSVKQNEQDLSRLVFASSFSHVMQWPKVICEIAKVLSSHVTFLHIRRSDEVTNDETIYRMMDETAENCGITLSQKSIFESHDVEAGIEQFCTVHQTGLLVLESKGRTGISRWIAGCVSADLVNHYEHALLTFKS